MSLSSGSHMERQSFPPPAASATSQDLECSWLEHQVCYHLRSRSRCRNSYRTKSSSRLESLLSLAIVPPSADPRELAPMAQPVIAAAWSLANVCTKTRKTARVLTGLSAPWVRRGTSDTCRKARVTLTYKTRVTESPTICTNLD